MYIFFVKSKRTIYFERSLAVKKIVRGLRILLIHIIVSLNLQATHIIEPICIYIYYIIETIDQNILYSYLIFHYNYFSQFVII